MFLFDRQPEGQGIKLQINTYVPEIKYTYTFLLNEHEVRESVEKIVDRQGPLSWSEMIKKDVLVQIGSRLIAKILCDHPIIIFCKRDIAEKGHLISRQTLHHNVNLFILSIYRSRFDIVIRVYEPETCDLVRTKIDMDLLSEWLHEDQKMRSKDSLSALKFCDLARLKNDQKANNEQSNIKFSIPELLQIDRQQDLVKWLSKRIQVIKVDGRTRNKIVLQFEAEVEHMQRVARKFQSLWRGKYAKKRARKQVHEQFEKHRDWESKNFFYVNTKTGTKQWNKPYLLQEEEDIVDPPDEWRQEIYHDSETDETSKYYFNPLTGQSSWLSENDAATFVQRKFRDRQTKLIMPSSMSFLETAKIVKMIKDTETKYQQCPSKLSNIVNFALLCQCIRFDIDEARTHYRDATKKSSCHPVVARAYGIFILSTCTPPLTQSFDKACQLFKQAETKDPDQRMFETTKQFFFSWSLIVNPNHSLALLNYALLHQCILGEYYRAEMIYRRALSIDPTNECLVHNYKLFEDQRYPGGYYADSGVPNTIVKRSKMIEDDPSWGEWKKMTDPFSSKAGFETFWYNEIDETSTFIEPDWKSVWLKRQERSKRISANNKSLWVEYYDEQLKAVFLHNRTSGEFVWQRPIIARDKQPWTFASSP
jgi:Tfp pilus assembly protein PilF